MEKITVVPAPKRSQWDSHLVRTIAPLKIGGISIQTNSIMKITKEGRKFYLIGQVCKCCNNATVYPISANEVLSAVEFIIKEEPTEPVNDNAPISIDSMKTGEYYRVSYGGTFIIGRFRKTNHVNLFWYSPYYHKWEKYESLKNSDWTVMSHITSIQPASDEDIQRYNDMVQFHNSEHGMAS